MNILTPDDFQLSHTENSKICQWVQKYAHKIDDTLSSDLQMHLQENNDILKKRAFILSRDEEHIRFNHIKDIAQDNGGIAAYFDILIQKEDAKIALYGEKENPHFVLTRPYINHAVSRILNDTYAIYLQDFPNRELAFRVHDFFRKDHGYNTLSLYLEQFYEWSAVNHIHLLEKFFQKIPLAISYVHSGNAGVYPLHEYGIPNFVYAWGPPKPPKSWPDMQKDSLKKIFNNSAVNDNEFLHQKAA